MDKLVMPPDVFVRAANEYCKLKGITDPEVIFKLTPMMEELAMKIIALKNAGAIV